MPANRTYPNIPEGFVESIKLRRLSRGMTQRQLGTLIGQNNGALVAQYEKGTRNVTYNHAKIINKVLDMGYKLPKVDMSQAEEISRWRGVNLIQKDPFLIVVNGEVIQVLTYRKMGEVTPAYRVHPPR